MILFDADDPLVLDGTYDREGFRPNERKRFEKRRKMSGAVECNQHPPAPNHAPVIRGDALMATQNSTICPKCAGPKKSQSARCRFCVTKAPIERANRRCPQCGGVKSFDAAKCLACAFITDPVDRFWSRVDRSGECWLWTRGSTGNGYGMFSEAKHKLVLAHRYSWELANGSIPEGMFVCHTCDTPRCVRPEHLFLGTNAENMQDASRKGRLVGKRKPRRGEESLSAKLTAADVAEIRARLSVGESQSALGRRYGVTQSAIWLIKTGKNWRE